MHDKLDAIDFFQRCLEQDPEESVPLTAIKTLIHFIKLSEAGTISELHDSLKTVIRQLRETTEKAHRSVTSIASGCELLLRFITLAAPEDLLSKDFSECKRVLAQRGELFLQKAENSRKKISDLSQQFIRDGSVILTHSKSRVVLQVLLEAAARNKRFRVYVTQSHPGDEGMSVETILRENNIPCTMILDSGVGYIMERVDMVLLGAESIVESGGIINKLGTFQMAVLAKAMNKPVYTAAESFKFLREYPLKQKEVENRVKYLSSEDIGHPLVDYTPPSYITLLFTDLGVLTPSAVSDELIKLYL